MQMVIEVLGGDEHGDETVSQKCRDVRRSLEMRDEEGTREEELNLTAEQQELNIRDESFTYNHINNITSCSRSTTHITQSGAIHPAVARYNKFQLKHDY